MMIWFAGILENACCNGQEKRWVDSVMSLNTATPIDI